MHFCVYLKNSQLALNTKGSTNETLRIHHETLFSDTGQGGQQPREPQLRQGVGLWFSGAKCNTPMLIAASSSGSQKMWWGSFGLVFSWLLLLGFLIIIIFNFFFLPSFLFPWNERLQNFNPMIVVIFFFFWYSLKWKLSGKWKFIAKWIFFSHQFCFM